MEQFRSGLRSGVKDLLLTFPEDPKSLTEAISRAVRCDNRLFEHRCEQQQQITRSRFTSTYASVTTQSSPRQTYSTIPTSRQTHSRTPMDHPTPMEIDMTQRRGRREATTSGKLFVLILWRSRTYSHSLPA